MHLSDAAVASPIPRLKGLAFFLGESPRKPHRPRVRLANVTYPRARAGRWPSIAIFDDLGKGGGRRGQIHQALRTRRRTFVTGASPDHDQRLGRGGVFPSIPARSRWKRTSARSASAARRTRPSRGTRGSPSSPPLRPGERIRDAAADDGAPCAPATSLHGPIRFRRRRAITAPHV